MFDHIHTHAALLHDEMKVIFWILLTPLLVILITNEILKSDNNGANVIDILKRAIIAVIGLILFDFAIEAIAVTSDGVAQIISDKNDLLSAVKKYGSSISDSDMGFFDFRKHILFFFAIGAYLFAYIGYFSSVALVNFLWAILYVFAPLMILCFIPRSTSYITRNLFKSLITVSVWKVCWSLLGAFLLKMAVVPEDVGFEGAILSMTMNLIIGLSMLLVPIFTRSLISDGLQNAATGLAVAPALLAVKVAAAKAQLAGSKGVAKGKDGASFFTKPLLAPSKHRMRESSQKIKKRFSNFKDSVSDFLEDEQSGEQNQEQVANRGYYRKRGFRSQSKKVLKGKSYYQRQNTNNFNKRRSKNAKKFNKRDIK